MLEKGTIDWSASDFPALLRGPFFASSLLVHSLLLFAALFSAKLIIPKPETNTPISVQLMEVTSGADTKSIGPGQGAGGPRALPKLGLPNPPAQRSGKLDMGSLDTSLPAPMPSVEAAPAPKPIALPGPKVLALDRSHEAVNAKETSADSLVQLPTKERATKLPSSVNTDVDAQQRNLAALKVGNDSAGIRALKEGPQIPGALKGSGTNTGAYGMPGGSRSGTGIAGGGTGVGSGGGGVTGLRGIPGSEFDGYLDQIKKRVQSAWKYPDGITGVQKLQISFVLDRAGKLVRAEVIQTTDPRLNTSALEAMRRASPFPPIPQRLIEHIANEPIGITFTVTSGIRG